MQYTPFASDIELPFYTALASLKINHARLDDSPRKVVGFYEIRPSDPPNVSSRMQIHGNALTSDSTPTGYYRAEGLIKNVNTIEEYRNTDKTHTLQDIGRKIWDAILDGSIYSCPSLLSSFIIVSFADLKKYKFHYWFAFPALHSDPPWLPIDRAEPIDPNQDGNNNTTSSLKDISLIESSKLVEAVQTWSRGVDARQRGFFLAKKCWNAPNEATSISNLSDASGFSWSISSLSYYEGGFFNDSRPEDCYVCLADPSNYDSAPGWMLRNLLVLVKRRWDLHKVQILRYRDTNSKSDQGRSTVMVLESSRSETDRTIGSRDSHSSMPKVTGWERNPAGKLTGKVVDLTEYMDPKRLADQSVDLNLKLMKWRISPNLDLEKVKNTKCLLLGAGTLGSYVARNLMGWGVTKITFVDNGTVSFSNPVRQPLFNFNDCLGGGTKKAHRASQALLEIYPGVKSTGHALAVPMVGHPVIDAKKAQTEYDALRRLIDEHDVIFLLMDTRESRWLPTVMAKAAGKIVMNAALGFDSFVVMRHGVPNNSDPASELGCYFCNDVVAPMNSVKDQTLDQQCTVTRPGVAAIASALLVELLVSLLQHPQCPAAPASASSSDDRGDHPLGLVPHQIRGFLSTFENISITGKSYKCCSACSANIVNAYRTKGWEFVQKALNEHGYVEEISGLKEVQLTAEAAIDDIEWDEPSDNDEAEII